MRDTAVGPEVFMLQRTSQAAFLGGAYVFPGGAVDPADGDADLQPWIDGLDDAIASARLGIGSGGLAYWVAGLRECFEEAGILLAVNADGTPISQQRLAQLDARRAALIAGTTDLAAILRAECLRLAARELVYYAHWITPPRRTRRFDTRFFIVTAPEGQDGLHDNIETVHSVWTTPTHALERVDRAEIEVAFATRCMLADLARFPNARAAIDHARATTSVPCNRTCIAQGGSGEKIFRPGDAPYAEVQWSDPDETTETSYELRPGIPKRLDRLVTRVIAPNPGFMTGPGTNTYMVGADRLATIDPGPADESHLAAIVAAAQAPIAWILCTHTHRDHSPAAAMLKRMTGAQVIGCPPPAQANQDASFAPDRVPGSGELLRLDGLEIRAFHTPGHASNHVCYRLEATGMLFSGDHVMQGSTVVINPPDGDMRVYLASLESLLGIDIAIIAPGHGYLIGGTHDEVRRLIRHRLARESKVLVALARHDSATVAQLVPEVYDDVPARAYPVAARSLLAHLLKLVGDGLARQSGDVFIATARGAASARQDA